jgi:hypothetical protein
MIATAKKTKKIEDMEKQELIDFLTVEAIKYDEDGRTSNYSDDAKKAAVRLTHRFGLTIHNVANILGCSAPSIANWKRQQYTAPVNSSIEAIGLANKQLSQFVPPKIAFGLKKLNQAFVDFKTEPSEDVQLAIQAILLGLSDVITANNEYIQGRHLGIVAKEARSIADSVSKTPEAKAQEKACMKLRDSSFNLGKTLYETGPSFKQEAIAAMIRAQSLYPLSPNQQAFFDELNKSE